MLAPARTSCNWNYFVTCSPVRPASPSGCVDAVHKIWIFSRQRQIALDPETMSGVAQMPVSGVTSTEKVIGAAGFCSFVKPVAKSLVKPGALNNKLP